MKAQPLILLDKDGTLIENVPYNIDPEKIRLAPGAAEGLQMLRDAGYALVVVSNQPGIGQGFFPESELGRVYEKISELLKEFQVSLSGFYYCPHHPYASCECRKPMPGLILKAAQDFRVLPSRTWMVGDILDDVEAGRRASCQTILIDNGNETEWVMNLLRSPHFVAPDLAEAAKIVIASEAKQSTYG